MREISPQYFSMWESANRSPVFLPFSSLSNETFYLLPSSHFTVAMLAVIPNKIWALKVV